MKEGGEERYTGRDLLGMGAGMSSMAWSGAIENSLQLRECKTCLVYLIGHALGCNLQERQVKVELVHPSMKALGLFIFLACSFLFTWFLALLVFFT